MSASNIFKVGDYVEYTTDHENPLGSPWKGSTGVIIDPNCSGWEPYMVCQVDWLTGGLVEYQRVGNPNVKNYTRYIRLIEVPYDPTQMGDKEDDI